MVNYQKGKIYKIVSDSSDNVYVGSTCKLLCQRIACHKGGFKRWQAGKSGKCLSYDIIKYGDAQIFLLENYPCHSKEELNARERWYIENTENSINKILPGRTKQEYRKENYQKIREKQKQQQKQKHACICGGRYINANKKAHSRTSKHKKWWSKQQEWLDAQKIEIRNKIEQIAIDKAYYCNLKF